MYLSQFSYPFNVKIASQRNVRITCISTDAKVPTENLSYCANYHYYEVRRLPGARREQES